MKLSKILLSLLVLLTISCKEDSSKEEAAKTDLNKKEMAEKSETSGAASGFVEVSEPHKSTSFQIDEGKNVYKVACAICHGPGGKGDGIAGRSLKPKPRDLIIGKWTKGGDSISLFKTITNGVSGTSMAGFKQLELAKRWAVVHYIRSITKNKVKDNEKKLEAFAKTAK